MINFASLLSLIATVQPACQKEFLGIKPWYAYLNIGPPPACDIISFHILPKGGKNGYPSDVPLVLLAIVDDLLRLAGLIAVGFIIYGAFQFVGSQGNPDAASKARTTIVNALIGLAIAVAAVGFVGYLGRQIGK